ncbi:MAG: type II secretion system protein [Rhodobacteraceae bacterium]|nr:type II secretion system protein [Paracoccaceae bacterium]
MRERMGAGGYTYVSVLIVLVALALAAQTTWIPPGTEAKRAREAELLFEGMAYRDAIGSYWRAEPEDPAYPASLDDLLDDPRAPGTRHIRRLYGIEAGPPRWTEAWNAEGRIEGVILQIEGTPLKTAGFAPGLEELEDAERYSDWVFRFVPPEEQP